MLSPSQRARILHHLEHGWKLPDSLVRELWTAYETLEQQQTVGADKPGRDDRDEPAPRTSERWPRRELR